MSGAPLKKTKPVDPEIDFKRIQDIVYWAKKWEVSPHQVIKASNITKSNHVKVIEEYLRNKGFAL